jgi:hypothetical protein
VASPQIGLGAGQALLGSTPPTVGFTATWWVSWNGGCAAVIVGTLLASPVTVSLGSGMLAAALVMSARVARGPSRWPLARVLYLAILIVLVVSIPIGVALAWARH